MSTKYLLCRPEGGLNDSLCQIEICWRYAEQEKRHLIIDFQNRELFRVFFGMLFPVHPTVPVTINPSPEMLKSLDRQSVVPPELRGRVSSYLPVRLRGRGLNWSDGESGKQLTFDFSKSYSEEVLVHHREGGGNQSFRAIERFRVKSEFREMVEAKIPSLPKNYTAVHVRNTDYRSELTPLFNWLKRHTGPQKVLFCSDSNSTLQAAKNALGDEAIVTFPFHGVVTDEPLHLKNTSRHEAKSAALQLLAEIWAVSQADRFVTTFVGIPGVANPPRISGMSRLMAHMVSQRIDLRSLSESSDSGGAPKPGVVVLTGSSWQKIRFFLSTTRRTVIKRLQKFQRRLRLK